jgi:hypothetical protein
LDLRERNLKEKEKYILRNFITCALHPIKKHVIIEDSKIFRTCNTNGKCQIVTKY